MQKRLLALLLVFSFIFSCAPAQALSYADGSLRVYLLSLGDIQSLDFTLEGSYTINGNPDFRLDRGTRITVSQSQEAQELYLLSGGLSICMGASFSLTRVGKNDAAMSGAYLSKSEKDTLYPGDFQITAGKKGIEIILTIDMEDYLYGVVPYEMANSFPLEALKAQAVAARNYAYRSKLASQDESYDLVDTTKDQVFKGYDPENTNAIRAVDETRGVLGCYNGEVVMCWYAASNGGQTARPEDIWGGEGNYGYLALRDDPYDVENPFSVVKTLDIATDGSQLDKRLTKIFLPQLAEQLAAMGYSDNESEMQIVKILRAEGIEPKYENTRMYTKVRFYLTVAGRMLDDSRLPAFSPAATEAPADLFASFFNTPSSPVPANTPAPTAQLKEGLTVVPVELTADITVYDDLKDGFDMQIISSDYELVSTVNNTDSIRIEMRRYGHGVGMSQRGAEWMAGKYNAGYKDILAFYYPGMELVSVQWKEKEPAKLAPLPIAAQPVLPALEPGESYAYVQLSSASSTLNVRKEPHTDADIVGTLSNRSRIIVTSCENGWAKIRTSELDGYVSMNFIVYDE